MDIHRGEDAEWVDAPAQHFTGRAQFGTQLSQEHLNALAVRFEAGARTDWHHHPKGQVLYVLEGSGRIREEGSAAARFEAGDTLYTPPGKVHWHGAGPDAPMMHISLTSGEDGTVWHPRKVSEEEYNRDAAIRIPREKDILFSVLQALGAIGGSGKTHEVREAVDGLLGVTQEQRSSMIDSGTPRIDDRANWASDKLNNVECLEKEEGVWSLTEKGREFLHRSQQESPEDLNNELWSAAMRRRARSYGDE